MTAYTYNPGPQPTTIPRQTPINHKMERLRRHCTWNSMKAKNTEADWYLPTDLFALWNWVSDATDMNTNEVLLRIELKRPTDWNKPQEDSVTPSLKKGKQQLVNIKKNTNNRSIQLHAG